MSCPLDIAAHDIGSLLTVRGCSELGKLWLDRHLRDAECYGGAILVEHRYGPDLLAGALADGLFVTLDGREPRESA